MSSVSIESPKTLVKLVEELIKEYPKLGYNNVQDFIQEAIRNHIIDIRKYLRKDVKFPEKSRLWLRWMR